MKKSIHSESEMVKAVKELESGVSAEVVARKHGVTRATCYNWEVKIQWYGCKPGQMTEGTGGGEPEAEADVRRPCIGQPDIEGCYWKKL